MPGVVPLGVFKKKKKNWSNIFILLEYKRCCEDKFITKKKMDWSRLEFLFTGQGTKITIKNPVLPAFKSVINVTKKCTLCCWKIMQKKDEKTIFCFRKSRSWNFAQKWPNTASKTVIVARPGSWAKITICQFFWRKNLNIPKFLP